jgi:hypothetical protein
MREINGAYRLVAFTLASDAQSSDDTSVACVTPATKSPSPDAGMSPDRIGRIVAAIKCTNSWSLWPRMSRSRWTSVGVLLGYVVVAAAILPSEGSASASVTHAAGRALGYFWLPLFLIWRADNDASSREARLVFQVMGWILMVAPAFIGLAWWVRQ